VYVSRSTRRTVNETRILELQYGVKECDQRIGMCPMKPNRFQQASFAPDSTRIMNQAFEFARIALNNREDFDKEKWPSTLFARSAMVSAIRFGWVQKRSRSVRSQVFRFQIARLFTRTPGQFCLPFPFGPNVIAFAPCLTWSTKHPTRP